MTRSGNVRPAPGIVLVGPRGAGKSTVATAVGNHLGWPHRDTDDLIAQDVGYPAGAFLASVGEASFRVVEERIVTAALADNGGRVLALGGGAVLSAKTRSQLAHGEHFVVFLFAPVPVLLDRANIGPIRPPLTDLPPDEEVARLWQERLPLYQSVSDLELDTFSANVSACVRSIMATMGHSGE